MPLLTYDTEHSSLSPTTGDSFLDGIGTLTATSTNASPAYNSHITFTSHRSDLLHHAHRYSTQEIHRRFVKYLHYLDFNKPFARRIQTTCTLLPSHANGSHRYKT